MNPGNRCSLPIFLLSVAESFGLEWLLGPLVLHPVISFLILLTREREDWAIAHRGNAVRGKSGLHGQGAG